MLPVTQKDALMITQDVPSRSSALSVMPTVAVTSVPAEGKKRPVHWADDVLLPEQFFGPRVGVSAVRPEVALMQAVLEEAMVCLQGHFGLMGRRGRRLAQEAEAWFLSEDAHWPFAFISICEVLNLEPTAVRAALLRWRCDPQRAPLRKMRRSVTVPRAVRLSA
jgi:hypothetical protein